MKSLLVITFLLLLIIPLSYAETYTIKPVSGSGSPNCQPVCFTPSIVSIEYGDIIHFINTDNTPHTLTSGTPSNDVIGNYFDTGVVPVNGDYILEIYQLGILDYFCFIHPWMTGVIIVTDINYDQDEITSQKDLDLIDDFIEDKNNYTPSSSYTSSVDWKSRYLSVLSDFNTVSTQAGKLKQENKILTLESNNIESELLKLNNEINEINIIILELEATIDNLNDIVMEQVKVIYDMFIGN